MRKITDERLSRQAQETDPVKKLSSAQRTALAVAQDYPVFPCDGETKRPLVEHGFKAATQDAAIVTRWWQKYPDALIGVPTGSASGLVAIDVDPEGRGWLQKVQGQLGAHRLHGTRRGKHLLYRMNGVTVRNSASQVADGVDVRGEGGYIVWWPAHGGVSVGEPGELPAWLAKAVRTAGVVKLNGHTKPAGWSEVPDGQRDDWLSARAYSLAKAGWGEEKILDVVRALSNQHCNPPKTEKELLHIVRGKRKFIDPDTEVELIRADKIPDKPVDWLWKGFLARNKFHLLSGSGGTMKSTLALMLAATISKGGKWPDGTRCPRGNVVIWTGEDDLGDTAKPRLRWSGADLTHCYFVKGIRVGDEMREFDPATDAPALRRVCAEVGNVSAIIVDPIVVVVQKDNNSASDVRRSLQPLTDLAAEHNAVLLGLQHFTKGSKGKDPAERVLGSGAWVHRARIVLAAAAIDEGEGQNASSWVFTCVKTFAKSEGGFEYGFEEEPQTEIARIVWGKPLQGTGHHIISEAEGNGDGESKMGAAKAFLKTLLANGSVNVWEVKKRYEEAGIKEITIKRAKKSLGIETMQAGKSSFRWKLPD